MAAWARIERALGAPYPRRRHGVGGRRHNFVTGPP